MADTGSLPARLAARRSTIELPIKAAVGGTNGSASKGDFADAADQALPNLHADDEQTAGFDVPAFLRRHEG